MKRSLLALAALCAFTGAAHAAVEVTSPETWNLYRGTTIEARGFPTKAACQAAAPLDLARRCVGSESFVRRADAPPPPPPTCPAAPAPQTQQAACPSGTTGTFTQNRTASVGPAPTCTITWSAWAPTTPPTGACTPVPPPPPPPTGTVLYFSDCQTGAAVGCVPGNDANPGTEAAPKRALPSLNTLPAGATVLLKRGGSFGGPGLILNTNATLTAPLTIGAYGTGPRAVLIGPINVGRFNDARQHGGYVFRGIKLDGNGSSGVGFMIFGGTRSVVMEDVEVTRFRTGIESQASNGAVTLRNSFVQRNSQQGFFGWADSLTLEGNRFEANNTATNPQEAPFYHGTYIGGSGRSLRIVGNTYVNNASATGTCLGGNLTVHGQWEAGLIENNSITVPSFQPGCYGISVNPGYSTAEWMRNFVIRGNRVANTNCGVCASSVPNVLIENNIVWAGGTFIAAGENQVDGGDLRSTGVVRGNTHCGGSGSVFVAGSVTQSGNRALPLTDAACAR